MITRKLLDALHQANFVYHNEHAREIYLWHGAEFIKIYNYLGDELGTCTIVNYSQNKVYNKYEQINIRDVTLSIDAIVNETYNEQKKEEQQTT